MPNSTAPGGSVQAIDRAFLVLETVAKNESMSLNSLHKELGLNKASLLRVAMALCDNGYLLRDAKTGDYSLSLKAFEVGVHAVRNLDYINLVKGELEALSNELNIIAQFSIEDNNELLCLESFDKNNSPFSIYTRVGERSPLYSTSAGKAILSTYSNEEILSKWEKMDIKPLTPNTIQTVEELMQDIARIRERNYALDLEENEPGLFCVGTVLMNYNRKPLGAISLSSRSMTEEDRTHYAEVLLQHTQRLSYMLGYSHR